MRLASRHEGRSAACDEFQKYGSGQCANRIFRNSVLYSTLDVGCCFLNPNYPHEEEELYGTSVDEGGSAARLW
jgi:hypothetical protein